MSHLTASERDSLRALRTIVSAEKEATAEQYEKIIASEKWHVREKYLTKIEALKEEHEKQLQDLKIVYEERIKALEQEVENMKNRETKEK